MKKSIIFFTIACLLSACGQTEEKKAATLYDNAMRFLQRKLFRQRQKSTRLHTRQISASGRVSQKGRYAPVENNHRRNQPRYAAGGQCSASVVTRRRSDSEKLPIHKRRKISASRRLRAQEYAECHQQQQDLSQTNSRRAR